MALDALLLVQPFPFFACNEPKKIEDKDLHWANYASVRQLDAVLLLPASLLVPLSFCCHLPFEGAFEMVSITLLG